MRTLSHANKNEQSELAIVKRVEVGGETQLGTDAVESHSHRGFSRMTPSVFKETV